MRTDELTVSESTSVTDLVQKTVAVFDCPRTQVAYRKALTAFAKWKEGPGQSHVTVRASLAAYRDHLSRAGKSASTVNQAMAAIRAMITTLVDSGVLQQSDLAEAKAVRGVRHGGIRTGRWLDKTQCVQVIGAADNERDKAIIAVLIGCGLRRAELCSLQMRHLQIRQGRPVFANLRGKGGFVRTVAIPAFSDALLNEWLRKRPERGDDKIFGVAESTVMFIVSRAGKAVGISVAPHDLRRTHAKLAKDGGAALDQIQMGLGHTSIATTQRYLGMDQRFDSAPGDAIGL